MATPEDIVDEILEELRHRFQEAGRGSVKAAATAIGKHPNYFAQQRNSRSVDLLTLIRTLEALDVNPRQFLLCALSDRHLFRQIEESEPVGFQEPDFIRKIREEWNEEKKRLRKARSKPNRRA